MRCLTDNEKKDIIDKMSHSRIEIDESLLNECYDEIYKLVLENISLMKGGYIEIKNGSLITFELLEKLANNNRKIFYLDLYDHELSVDEYNLFRSGVLIEVIADSIDSNFFGLLNKDNASDYKLSIRNRVNLSSLDEGEFNLTFIPNEVDLKMLSFYKKINFCVDRYDILLDLIKRLEDNGIDYTIDIKNIDENKLYEFLKGHEELINNKRINCIFRQQYNLEVELDESVLLGEFYKVENKIDDMVKPAFNLSPFEKFLFVYDLVKNFRKYKEYNDKNKNFYDDKFVKDYLYSRGLYKVFEEDNPYIVCAGYINLMVRFFKKLGLNGVHYSFRFNKGFKDIGALDDDFLELANNENAMVKFDDSMHDICLVNIVDPKYNIDEFVFSDPTNDSKSTGFAFALMSIDDITNGYYGGIKFESNDVTNLMLAHNKEEFYKILYRSIGYGTDDFRNVKDKLLRFIFDLMKIIKELDFDYYRELCEDSLTYREYERMKFADCLEIGNLDVNSDDFCSLIDKLSNYIIKKSSVNIDLRSFYSAYGNVLSGVYGLDDEEIYNQICDSVMESSIRAKFAFPSRIIIDKDGNETSIVSSSDKWIGLQRNYRFWNDIEDGKYKKR